MPPSSPVSRPSHRTAPAFTGQGSASPWCYADGGPRRDPARAQTATSPAAADWPGRRSPLQRQEAQRWLHSCYWAVTPAIAAQAKAQLDGLLTKKRPAGPMPSTSSLSSLLGRLQQLQHRPSSPVLALPLFLAVWANKQAGLLLFKSWASSLLGLSAAPTAWSPSAGSSTLSPPRGWAGQQANPAHSGLWPAREPLPWATSREKQPT